MPGSKSSTDEQALATGALYVGNERHVCAIEAIWAQGVVLRAPASVPVGLFARLHIEVEGGLDLDTVVRKQHGTTWTGFRIELELYEPSLIVLQQIDRLTAAPRKAQVAPTEQAPMGDARSPRRNTSAPTRSAEVPRPAATRSVAGLSAVRTQQGVAVATPLSERAPTRAPEDRSPPRARQTAPRGIRTVRPAAPTAAADVPREAMTTRKAGTTRDAEPLSHYKTDAAALLSIYRDAVKDIDGKSSRS